jgi:zeta-carotene desaturase
VVQDNTVTGVALVNSEALEADAIVLATGHHAAGRLLPDLGLPELEDVPILGVHLWFDRPVMNHPHVALIDGPLQWLFRKDHAGKSLHGVISAAREWVGKPKDESLKLFEQQVRGLFPAARAAKLERGVIVIEKRATFSPLPGTDRLRPPQGSAPGGIKNLYLAGDYTQSGWPATMEGAVRSGYLAAEALTKDFLPSSEKSFSFMVPDLPRQWPSRLLEG